MSNPESLTSYTRDKGLSGSDSVRLQQLPPISVGLKNIAFMDLTADLPEKNAFTSSDSVTDESSSLGSSYSSTGVILCSLSKDIQLPSPTYSEGTYDYFNMGTEKNNPMETLLKEEDMREIQDYINRVNQKEGCRIFPQSSAVHLSIQYSQVYHCLTDALTEGWCFVTPSIFFTHHKELTVQKPEIALFDACLFSPNRPIIVLTIISKKEKDDSVLRYNTEAAKVINRFIDNNTSQNARVVHSIAHLSDFNILEEFRKKLDQIISNAQKIALPGRLHMDVTVYRDISKQYVTTCSRTFLENDRSCLPDEQYLNPPLYGLEDTPDSSISVLSKDSGCFDVDEHKKLQKEVKELKTENKVLRWRVGHFNAVEDCDNDLDTDGPSVPARPGEPFISERVYRYVFKSMKGELIDELNCDAILGTLVESKVVSEEAARDIRTEKIRKKQNVLLLHDVMMRNTMPLFVTILESTGTNQHLCLILKEQLDINGRMAFLQDHRHSRCLGEHFADHGLDDIHTTSLVKQPEKIVVLDRKGKLLKRISFQLRILLHEGHIDKYKDYISSLTGMHSGDPDVMFHVFESESLKERIFRPDDFDQTEILSQMECLIPKLSHPVLGTMILLARKGSAFAMKNDLQNALDSLRESCSQMMHLQPCLETVLAMNTLINILMLRYEGNPFPTNKDKLISEIAQSVDFHVPNVQQEIRDEFRRVFYLKMTFCYLGVGIFGSMINCHVTEQDVKTAEACLNMTETFPGTFVGRRSMFYSLAKAVLHSNRKQFAIALKYAKDSQKIASACGFRKEMATIKKWSEELKRQISKKSPENDLIEALQDLDTMT